ncbi:MAG TPA: hypothetical protein HA252_02335 [Candidatus Diapherotrites archaeon]|uniref:Uncharacterized protein n=1 Tax=Candidatus Iainarchaeum sp. TaxID=3101447 RepID=A0A7J4JGG9_9ARCH|nr:hypothetical protein [Candidatus Diapherotrites archaeon]HIH16220.1 hypothetical protein [Candidatus Diapherotrites archaeon]
MGVASEKNGGKGGKKMSKPVIAGLACLVLLLSGCVQVTTRNGEGAKPTGQQAQPVAGEKKADSVQPPANQAPQTAPPKQPRRDETASAPLDLTKVVQETGQAPPQLPDPAMEGLA